MSTERDASGDLRWDPDAFPTGDTLGAYVHAAGFKFGMSFQKDKEKLQNVKPHDFDGEWEAGDTGIYSMNFMPKVAGVCELQIWCVPNDKGDRQPFPGSPFRVAVVPGKASPAISAVEPGSSAQGWSKVAKEEKNMRPTAGGPDTQTLYASDSITIGTSPMRHLCLASF